MRSRLLPCVVVGCLGLLSSAGLAHARAPEAPIARPAAPVALFVDGVKVGSTETLAVSKTQATRGGTSCSSCTVMVTY